MILFEKQRVKHARRSAWRRALPSATASEHREGEAIHRSRDTALAIRLKLAHRCRALVVLG